METFYKNRLKLLKSQDNHPENDHVGDLACCDIKKFNQTGHDCPEPIIRCREEAVIIPDLKKNNKKPTIQR